MSLPLKEKYINLLTDFGFQRVLGSEPDQNSLKYYRDLNNVVDTSWQEGKAEGIQEGLETGLAQGREEGRQEGLQQVAKQMKAAGMDITQIATMTGLPIEAIETLEI